jgi:hypothetical protein
MSKFQSLKSELKKLNSIITDFTNKFLSLVLYILAIPLCFVLNLFRRKKESQKTFWIDSEVNKQPSKQF